MRLNVSKALKSPGTPFPFEATVELPPQDVLGETVRFEPVALQGSFMALDEGVLELEGQLSTTAKATCALCMGPAEAKMQVDFREQFRKDAKQDDEAFPYEGGKLDLEPMALTLVMLNLPMRFVCSTNCKGTAEWQQYQQRMPRDAEETAASVQHPFKDLERLLTKEEEV